MKNGRVKRIFKWPQNKHEPHTSCTNELRFASKHYDIIFYWLFFNIQFLFPHLAAVNERHDSAPTALTSFSEEKLSI